MPFIKSFSIVTDRESPFPFNISSVKFAKQVSLNSRVTIFVGDNGCGKSTLLASLGYSIKTPLIGGHIIPGKGFDAAKLLQPYLTIEWARETSRGFFFRAKDFSAFLDSVQKEKEKIMSGLRDLQGNVPDGVLHQMSENINFALREMRKDYGENVEAFSHGEAFLKILQTRILPKGIYLLDEPEAALSPLKQLSLIAFILEVLKSRNAQFIIATHSPIIMGIPGATLYEIQDDSMQPVEYKDTEHYRITKRFLDNPDTYLRHLVS